MRRQAGGGGAAAAGSGAVTPTSMGGAEGEAGGLAGATEAELQERAKRKGRFRYVEDDYQAAGGAAAASGGGPGSKQVSKSGSMVGLAEGGKQASGLGGGGGAGAPVQVLLAPLKELLESMTLQQEAMREMVRGSRGLAGGLGSAAALALGCCQAARPTAARWAKLHRH